MNLDAKSLLTGGATSATIMAGANLLGGLFSVDAGIVALILAAILGLSIFTVNGSTGTMAQKAIMWPFVVITLLTTAAGADRLGGVASRAANAPPAVTAFFYVNAAYAAEPTPAIAGAGIDVAPTPCVTPCPTATPARKVRKAKEAEFFRQKYFGDQ